MRRLPSVCLLLAMLAPAGAALARGGGGCFLADTPILRADGTSAAIASVRPGDRLLALAPDGNVTAAIVRQVLCQEAEEYAEVTTERAVLRVTGGHPFYVGDGRFRTLDSLTIGDRLYALEGGRLAPRTIAAIRIVRGRTLVYNLQTDEPHTFFAAGIAVHNKGGCFPAGTPILMPDGNMAIGQLRAGMTILGVARDGRLVPARVQAVHETMGALLILRTDRGELATTAEHPIALPDGGFLPAGELAAGGEVLFVEEGRMGRATVLGIGREGEVRRVLNLQVDGPHTFVAGGFVVHNKGGGCFPAGTGVLMPGGEVAIEDLRVGGRVLAASVDGRLVETAIEAVAAAMEDLILVETTLGTLRTTADHPLGTADGGFVPAGELRRGVKVLMLREGRLVPAAVLSVSPLARLQEVYNLRVGPPHTFIAGGFLVHNKGGGGGGFSGGSRSRGSGRTTTGPSVYVDVWGCAFVGGVIFVMAVIYAIKHRRKEDENLDYCYTRTQISRKEAKTRKLLEFIGGTDPAFKPETLQAHARDVFLKLQQCWEAREYSPMQPLQTEDLYRQHCAQLAGMARNHEINVIAQLAVEAVDIVNVRYTEKPDGREFTALITARARDYYVDDRTRAFLRGDDSPARFQEFWTFELRGGKWLLRQIEQTKESDCLKEENFFEPFTDRNVEQVYGEAAGREGPIGPWQEAAVAGKADRIDRLLNFLVRTDKLWDRTAMVERARSVYLHVMLAREAGDPSAVQEEELFPDLAESLRRQIADWRSRGLSQEYRNLCLRKAELVLVRNFADNSRDEYTVRISAHAQRITRKNGRVVSQDEYVSPFVEFWTFGRLDGRWKLKEVVPAHRGQALVGQENVDQDSTPAQLQWYYRQSRAV